MVPASEDIAPDCVNNKPTKSESDGKEETNSLFSSVTAVVGKIGHTTA
jgi:hypothetical protein